MENQAEKQAEEKVEQLELDWREMDEMGCFGSQERQRISPLDEEEPDDSSKQRGA